MRSKLLKASMHKAFGILPKNTSKNSLTFGILGSRRENKFSARKGTIIICIERFNLEPFNDEILRENLKRSLASQIIGCAERATE